MRILVEHVLIVITLSCFVFFNVCAGLMGIALGDYEYLLAKKKGERPSLWLLFTTHAKKFLYEHSKGDVSVMVGVLIFAHIGLIFLFLALIGPKNARPWIEPNNKIK